ncbi:MAG: flippase-like domain-containing protein [Dermatophilaceae bacterium]|nr:flippase-like domain-containing protein [Dermatophilaceae bacterium]
MPEPAARPSALDTKKSVMLGLLGLAVVVLIFVRLIPQIGSYHDAITSLKAMTAGAVACVVVSVLVYLAAYGLPFLAATPGLSYWRSQQLNQGAFAISNGVPAGGAFGLGVQYAMLASYAMGPTVSTAAITAVGVWSIFVTLGLPIFGVAAILLSGHGASSYLLTAVVSLLVLAVSIVAFALIVRSADAARRIGSIGNRIAAPIAGRSRKGHSVDVVPAALTFRSDISGLVNRRWTAITGSQVSVSITQFLILYMALRGVEGWAVARTSLLVAFGAFAVAQIGLMIPITPGGLGTVDAVMIALLTAMNVNAGAATAADLVWRAASFVPQIVIGIVALITWSRQGVRPGRVGSP